MEFVGGPRDGKHTFEFPGPVQGNEEFMMAVGFFHLTKGEVGMGTSGASPLQMQTYREHGKDGVEGRGCHYMVTERREDGDSLYVRAEQYTPAEE